MEKLICPSRRFNDFDYNIVLFKLLLCISLLIKVGCFQYFGLRLLLIMQHDYYLSFPEAELINKKVRMNHPEIPLLFDKNNSNESTDGKKKDDNEEKEAGQAKNKGQKNKPLIMFGKVMASILLFLFFCVFLFYIYSLIKEEFSNTKTT